MAAFRREKQMLKLIAGLWLGVASAAAFAQGTTAPPPDGEPATDQPPEPAAAEQPVQEQELLYEDEFDNRWYIVPSIGAVLSDAKDIDNGPYVSLGFGKLFDNFGFELEGSFSKLNVKDLSNSEDYQRFTLGGNFDWYPWRGGWEPYLQVAAYGHKVKFIETELPIGF